MSNRPTVSINSPHFYSLRVVRGKGNLTSNHEFVLPLANGGFSEQRQPNKIYLEDYLPSGSEHHTVLGYFIDRWGLVESNIANLMSVLLKTELNQSLVLMNAMGIRRTLDTIRALSTIEMTDLAINEIRSVVDRVTKLSYKRNVLVHGEWVVEFLVYEYKGSAVVKAQLLREAHISDRHVRERVGDIRNQKERSKYMFNLKRIHSACIDAINIANDIEETLTRLQTNVSSQGGN